MNLILGKYLRMNTIELVAKIVEVIMSFKLRSEGHMINVNKEQRRTETKIKFRASFGDFINFIFICIGMSLQPIVQANFC